MNFMKRAALLGTMMLYVFEGVNALVPQTITINLTTSVTGAKLIKYQINDGYTTTLSTPEPLPYALSIQSCNKLVLILKVPYPISSGGRVSDTKICAIFSPVSGRTYNFDGSLITLTP